MRLRLPAAVAAVGIAIGGVGDCGSGGSSFFQPIVDVLSAFGANVY